MSRVIKFRAWSPKDKLMCWFPERKMDDGTIFNYCEPHESFILMQYTGLKDKNGKEIYEGDIVQGEKDFVKGVVQFNESGYWMVMGHHELSNFFEWDSINFEVIGNIHENPELMETKK